MVSADTRNVIVVEDNALNLKLFEHVLQQGGYNPVGSMDGTGLRDLVLSNRAVCILMDIQLPNVSGFDLMQELRKDPACGAIPIVAVTAFAGLNERGRFIDAGFDAFLPKPISVRVLLSTVNQLAL